MATLAELEALADQIAAGEPEQLTKPSPQSDGSVRVAVRRRETDPFISLCLNARDVLSELVMSRWPSPNGLDPMPEHIIVEEFLNACRRLFEKKEPQQELPSSVLRRALIVLNPSAEPQDESPLIGASRTQELDEKVLQAPALKPAAALANELNLVWAGDGSIASALVLIELVRTATIMLGYNGLTELVEKHPGGSAFKAAMNRLNEAVRELDSVNHLAELGASAIRARINVRSELDQLLDELIRMTA